MYMQEDSKYEKIVNLFLDNWIIAIIVLVLVIVAFIPSLKDGINQIKLSVVKLNKNDIEDYSINFNVEIVNLKLLLRSKEFDIVKVNATTHQLGVLAEYKWIEKFYPKCNSKSQTLSKIEISDLQFVYFDIISINNEKGPFKKIYFDISSFKNGGTSTSHNINEFTRLKIKEIYKQYVNVS